MGDISDSENIALGREIDQRFDRSEGYWGDPYRRQPQARAGDFSRPVPGPPLELDHLAQETLHKALLDAFEVTEMQRLLNFKLNRRMDEISTGKNKRKLFYDVIQAAVGQGWVGALVVQAYRVNLGNRLLRAFVAEHLPELLEKKL